MMPDRNTSLLRLGNDLRDNPGGPVALGEVHTVDGERFVL
jgi:hypothetical protein